MRRVCVRLGKASLLLVRGPGPVFLSTRGHHLQTPLTGHSLHPQLNCSWLVCSVTGRERRRLKYWQMVFLLFINHKIKRNTNETTTKRKK